MSIYFAQSILLYHNNIVILLLRKKHVTILLFKCNCQLLSDMEQHKTLQFEGHTIHYRDEGRENTSVVVLLHGYLQNLDVWSSYTLSYMHELRVISIDLPGHGYTDTCASTHTMEYMARVVKAVLDNAGVFSCVMVGHSMGGYVSLAFAEAYPYMLKGMALLSSHAMCDDEARRSMRREAVRELSTSKANYIISFVQSLFDNRSRQHLGDEIQSLKDMSLETKQEGAIACMLGMMDRVDRISVLQRFDKPIYFVYGKNDTRIAVEMGLSQALEAQNAEILLLSDVAHMPHIEAREYLKPRLLNFIEMCYGR